MNKQALTTIEIEALAPSTSTAVSTFVSSAWKPDGQFRERGEAQPALDAWCDLFPKHCSPRYTVASMRWRRGRMTHRAAWRAPMGAEPDIKTLIGEIKAARRGIEDRDQKTVERVDELERSINEILIGLRRPGGGSYGDASNLERKSAITMCQDRHLWQHQKNEGRWIEYTPGADEINEAITAQKA
jgi:hypothetical protein